MLPFFFQILADFIFAESCICRNLCCGLKICDNVTVSAKTRLVHTTSNFFFPALSAVPNLRNGSPNFQFIVVSSFGIIALDNRKSKIIDLYSYCTENTLQALTFTAITSVYISLQHIMFTMD